MLILSANPETLDGLQAYLVGVGLQSQSLRAVHDFEKAAPERATAAVIFPDDFGREEVLNLLRRTGRTQPGLLVVLVTREPQHFRIAMESDSRPHPLVLLARPCFGWDILDVIRTHSPSAPV